eukprot:CFRG3087T1
MFVARLSEFGNAKQIWHKLMKFKELRTGTYVGSDINGNKYYEDVSYIFGRSRFVDLKNGYDPTSITPEWHRWMHAMTDYPPSRKEIWHPEWEGAPIESQTGSSNEYVPFRTTRVKVTEWDPNSK